MPRDPSHHPRPHRPPTDRRPGPGRGPRSAARRLPRAPARRRGGTGRPAVGVDVAALRGARVPRAARCSPPSLVGRRRRRRRPVPPARRRCPSSPSPPPGSSSPRCSACGAASSVRRCWPAGCAGPSSLGTDLGLRFRWIDLLGIPIGVAGQYLVALIYIPIEPHVHDFNQRFAAPAQRLTGGSHGIGYVVIAVATVVGAPFFEELFFRGVLLRALRPALRAGRRLGRARAWPCSSAGVLFGLAHAESLQLARSGHLRRDPRARLLPDRPARHEHRGPRRVQPAGAGAAVVSPARAGARGLV